VIAAVRQAFARRALRDAIQSRSARALEADPRARTVLLVLPDDEEGQRATWSLIRDLDLEAVRVQTVGLGSTGTAVPDAFAGQVRVIADSDLDWRTLPKPEVRSELWSTTPDVAINLADPDVLAAAILAGASPAAVRIGRHAEARESCYDLMIQGEPTAASAASALGRLLRQVDPPILPLR